MRANECFSLHSFDSRRTPRCYYCPNPVAATSRWRCQEHLDNARTGDRMRREFRVLLGLCGECKEPMVPGYAHCEYHMTYFRENKRKHRLAKRGYEIVRVPV